jgi:hypothetical protein
MRYALRMFSVVALAATAAFAQTGVSRADTPLSSSSCGPAAPVFAAWGDTSDYYFPANGGFEDGAAGWTLAGGAAVVDGNESFALHASTDSHALAIPAGGSASVSVCYGAFYPAVRVMAVGAGARIHVSVTTQNPLGFLSRLDGGTFTAGSSWAPSPKLSTLLSSVIAPLGASTMQLRFDVSGAPAEIDDLYVDPFVMYD